nr:MAG TPA: hypothetical protein [Caudoviricetes sp.]
MIRSTSLREKFPPVTFTLPVTSPFNPCTTPVKLFYKFEFYVVQTLFYCAKLF